MTHASEMNAMVPFRNVTDDVPCSCFDDDDPLVVKCGAGNSRGEKRAPHKKDPGKRQKNTKDSLYRSMTTGAVQQKGTDQMPHVTKSHKERKLSCNVMLTLDTMHLAELLVENRADLTTRSGLVQALIEEEAKRRLITLEEGE